ncbi:MAG: PQQ-dependent sugar dehydrogenase [Acidimicrobiales bacterium]|nr:PQQ-dependent sugar dehydrogenase [Acidimicrobiales bacterium]
MTHRRRLALIAAFALAAAACSDDAPGPAEPSNTTIPVVTTTGGAAPADESTSTTSTPATTTTADPRSVNGDLTTAAVAVENVGTYRAPIDTTVAPNGEVWLALRAGQIVVLDPDTGEIGEPIVDISAETTVASERGLLGLAVDDEALYVNFTDRDGNTNIDAFLLADGRPGDRHHLLTIDQPFSNHNGGALAIGPDGHLYIGVGDGGSANDPLEAGQDPNQILGSILRIDPTPGGDRPYEIPADNPFASGEDGAPEIFMTGLRNPWRISFDPVTDDFWIADVGQNEWEEINLLLGANGWGVGANLGWDNREGTHRFEGERPEGNVDPVYEYPHDGGPPSGCSISGGVVYRGLAIPELVGAYVFGDYCRSTVWAIAIQDGAVVFRDLGGDIERLVGITTDAQGELLAITLSGAIERIVPA